MSLLFDTCVVSALQREPQESPLRTSLQKISGVDAFLSVVTVGEIKFGLALLPESRRRDTLTDWLGELEANFGNRILPVTREVAHVWGEITAHARKSGRSLAAADGLIAATALHHGLQLVTLNVRDSEVTGVSMRAL